MLHQSTGHQGVLSWLIRLAAAAGLPDEEMEIRAEYEEALRAGATMIAVDVPTPLRARLAGEMLARGRATSVNLFRRFSIRQLVRGRVSGR